MTALRIAWRTVAIVLHVLQGLVTLGLVFPWTRRPTHRRLVRRWSRRILALCGVTLTVHGRPAASHAGRGLVWVANHISWLDVFLLHAIEPSWFIAKSEIRSWPFLGRLATGAGTLYIERGSRHAVHHVNTQIAQKLIEGEIVALFAEGTTTDGTELLPFHSNLFAAPIREGAPIQPAALRYLQHGKPTTAAAFVGEVNIVQCLFAILAARDLRAEVHLLAPIDTSGLAAVKTARHTVAERAREAIAACLGFAPADSALGEAGARAGARR